ncbi:MAG: hypothetical protein QXS85_03475 [Acidilobaceae archaeon]
MGVRSLATLVECRDIIIGVDLGAALAPVRFGLPPHILELKRLEEVLDSIRVALSESHLIIITHYHYDHYMKDHADLYAGKTLIVKNPQRDINFSQRMRSHRFLKKSGLIDKARVEFGDGRLFSIARDLTIEMSPPVWHGEAESVVGKVLMARIECEDEVAIFASDTQGPVDREALEILVKWSERRPRYLVIGGPATYLEGSKLSRGVAEKGLANLLYLIEKARPDYLIVDHHLLRDRSYRGYLAEHFRVAAMRGVSLLTAAEYEGRPVEQLEAWRRELWGIESRSRHSSS